MLVEAVFPCLHFLLELFGGNRRQTSRRLHTKASMVASIVNRTLDIVSMHGMNRSGESAVPWGTPTKRGLQTVVMFQQRIWLSSWHSFRDAWSIWRIPIGPLEHVAIARSVHEVPCGRPSRSWELDVCSSYSPDASQSAFEQRGLVWLSAVLDEPALFLH